MRRLHEAIGAVETYSPAEERFNRRRRTAGLLPGAGDAAAGPAAADARAPGRRAPPRRGDGVGRRAVGERGAADGRDGAARPGAGGGLPGGDGPARAGARSPIRSSSCSSAASCSPRPCSCTASIGGIAFTTLSSKLVGSSAVRMLVAYGGVATLISMWISNTATTAMLFPIGLSIVGHVGLRGTASKDAVRRFAMQHDAGHVVRRLGRRHGDAGRHAAEPDRPRLHLAPRRPAVSSFLAWTRLGVPLVLVLTVLLLGWFAWWGARGLRIDAEGLALVREERARLGPWTRGQRNVVVAFAVAVFCGSRRGLAAIGRPGRLTRDAGAGHVGAGSASPRSSAPCCCSCCRSTGGNGGSR